MCKRNGKQLAQDLLAFAFRRRFSTILADPPWRFQNRTGKMAPEHQRLMRYQTMTLQDIMELPVAQLVEDPAHLYLWVPNALLSEGLEVMTRWGFTYKTNIVWFKIRRDGGPDRRGVGFYFRNVTELVLFGVRGNNARTLAPGRRQANLLATRKREHSRKPDQLYDIIEACSPGPYLELFARHSRPGWFQWGDEHRQEPVGVEPALLLLEESKTYGERRASRTSTSSGRTSPRKGERPRRVARRRR